MKTKQLSGMSDIALGPILTVPYGRRTCQRHWWWDLLANRPGAGILVYAQIGILQGGCG